MTLRVLCSLFSLVLGQGTGRLPASGFGAELPLGAQGTPLHFNIPMERSQAYVSGLAPTASRPPAAAPFPASFPTGIWPPTMGLHRAPEAPQPTVPGQVPAGLTVRPAGVPVFNQMQQLGSNQLSQVGQFGQSQPPGTTRVPQAQMPNHPPFQREVLMETGSAVRTSEAAVGYGGAASFVMAFTAFTSMLLLKAFGGVWRRRELQALQEKVKRIPAIFKGPISQSDPHLMTPQKSELVIEKDASPIRKEEAFKVELETKLEHMEHKAKLERPEKLEKLEEPEAYVEMDGRLLSLDQLCQEIGARRVHSPRSSAASDEVLLEDRDVGVSPASAGHGVPPPEPPDEPPEPPDEPATPPRAPRKWRGGRRREVPQVKPETILEEVAQVADEPKLPKVVEEPTPETREERVARLLAEMEEGTFVTAKALRFRPTGCFVRVPGGREAFLPVEHMLPRTEASTNAVRATVTKTGQLRVRDIGGDRVSMLKALDEAAQGQELEARRRKMEEGIEKLRENYNPNKVMMGFVSSVQKNGVFVSVIDGQDALIPIKELPKKFLQEGDVGEAALKPTLEVGQAVHFRIIRYSWQTDGFTASMLPLESRSRPLAPGGGPRQEEEIIERAPSPDRSASAKVWAAKGYSVVTNEAAMELNQWLKSKMEDKKSKKGSKAVVKSTVTYLVSIARGMNTKAVGSIDMEKNVSEKEVKQAAVELLQKDGHLKAGEQHKGVTITKNIISVKL